MSGKILDADLRLVTSRLYKTGVTRPWTCHVHPCHFNGEQPEIGRVSTDDGGYIPAKYSEFVEVFSKTKADTLPPHRSIDHAIDLEPSCKIPYGRIYNLSEVELKTLKAYIETNLANGFIQQSSSPATAPILFAKKKDWGLRLFVDYRALNSATIKNQ